jgi:hypothetical protein
MEKVRIDRRGKNQSIFILNVDTWRLKMLFFVGFGWWSELKSMNGWAGQKLDKGQTLGRQFR